MIGRRPVLGGLLAAAALPARADTGNAALAALDAAAAEPDPAHALALLRGVRSASLTTGPRLDLDAARAGLAVDAAIRARGIDPAKGPRPRDPALASLLLRRKLGDMPGPAAARASIDRERDRCLARAGALFDEVGVVPGSVGERYRRLWRDGRFLYPDSDEGRDRAVADMNTTLARLRVRVVPLLGPVPADCLDVAARRSGAGAPPGTRTLPSPGQEGFYTVDLTDIRRRPRWTLSSVVAHELLPGHMIQLPMEATAAPHPLRLRYAPGFAEGWAIAAERLAADAGCYAGDPQGELGYLHWRLFRLGRAGVDIALAVDGIDADAARQRLTGWLGEPAYFAPFDADIARMAADPMTRAAECLSALLLERLAPPQLASILRHGRVRSEQLPRR